MNRLISPPRRGSMFFSDAYRDWCPTQSWLVEAIRAVATTLYAKATYECSDTKSFAVHRAAISGQLSRTFAAILDDALPELSIPVGIDLLVLLEDLAQIGKGYCVPRESRIVRLARNWGRIAGGLPLYSSEHPDLGIKSIHDNTIGRVAELIDGFDSHDRGTEHSEVFAWMGRNTEQIFADLNQDLPDRRSSQPPEKAWSFTMPDFIALARVALAGRRRHPGTNSWWQERPASQRTILFVLPRGHPVGNGSSLAKRKLGSGCYWSRNARGPRT